MGKAATLIVLALALPGVAAGGAAETDPLRRSAVVEAVAKARATSRTAEGKSKLFPNIEVLLDLADLCTRAASAEEWSNLQERSDKISIEQEPIEFAELRGLNAARTGDIDLAKVFLDRAMEKAKTVPTLMKGRLERSLALLTGIKSGG